MVKQFWTEESIALYERTCDALDYPAIPLDADLRQMINSEDTVMDIGCGPGGMSLYLAPLCRQVIAVDACPCAIDHLQQCAAQRGYANIQTYCGDFRQLELPACDVTVALYVTGMLKGYASAQRILEHTKREGLILTTHTNGLDILQKQIAQRLQIHLPQHSCHNGCFIAAPLNEMASNLQCRKIKHEFGQPLQDRQEACDFLQRILKIPAAYADQLSEIMEDYVEKRDQGWYVPNQRTSCLIRFQR